MATGGTTEHNWEQARHARPPKSGWWPEAARVPLGLGAPFRAQDAGVAAAAGSHSHLCPCGRVAAPHGTRRTVGAVDYFPSPQPSDNLLLQDGCRHPQITARNKKCGSRKAGWHLCAPTLRGGGGGGAGAGAACEDACAGRAGAGSERCAGHQGCPYLPNCPAVGGQGHDSGPQVPSSLLPLRHLH